MAGGTFILAKELKIQNLKRQREFIKSTVELMIKEPDKDGDTTFVYVGHVFPEVIAYFQGEGFCVKKVSDGTIETRYIPVYLFTISDKTILDDDDGKKAEEVDCSCESGELGEGLEAFLKRMRMRMADADLS